MTVGRALPPETGGHDVYWHRLQTGLMARLNDVPLSEAESICKEHLDFATGVRVVLPLQGAMDLHIGAHRVCCHSDIPKAGVWLNVAQHQQGSQYFHGGLAYRELVLFVSHAWLDDWCTSLPSLPDWGRQLGRFAVRPFVMTPVMRQLAAQFFALDDMPPLLQHAHHHSLVAQLWLAVVRQMVLEADEHPLLRREAQKRIHALTALLHSGDADHWTLAQMAAFGRTNVTTLQRHFQQCHGVSIWHYLRRLKLERAHQALQSGATVTQAAECAGYQHLESFSKAFKQQYGFTPIQVRVLS